MSINKTLGMLALAFALTLVVTPISAAQSRGGFSISFGSGQHGGGHFSGGYYGGGYYGSHCYPTYAPSYRYPVYRSPIYRSYSCSPYRRYRARRCW